MNQSNNSKSNDGTVLFNTGLSRLIERLSLIKKLKLLASPGKMSMLLKQMEWSDSKSQSETCDDVTFLTLVSVKFEALIYSAALMKK